MDELCYQIDKNTTIVEHPAAGTARAYVDGHALVRLDRIYITLDTGGVFNQKTLTSIKNTAYHFGLCFVVYKRNDLWYVETPNKEIKPLKHRVTFKREFNPVDAPPERDPGMLSFTYKKDIEVSVNPDTEAANAVWHWMTLVSIDGPRIKLNFAGPMDNDIQRRMNCIAGVLGLNFRVYAEKNLWYVDTPAADIRPLYPGIEMPKRIMKPMQQIIHDLQK